MNKLYTYLLLACLVMLPNMDWFNYLALGTPLVIWKQAFSVFLLLAFFPVFANLVKDPSSQSASRLLLLIAVMVVCTIVATLFSISNGIQAYRLSYGLIAYIGFMPLVLLPFLLLKFSKPQYLFNIIIVVGVFSGIGLILDYTTDILAFLPRSEEVSEAAKLLTVRRATFLFGAPTTIYPTLSFAMAMLMYLAIEQRGFFRRFAYFALIALMLVGFILTGSRSQVVLALALLALGSVGWVYYSKDRVFGIFVLCASVVALTFASSYGLGKAQQGEYLFDRYKSAFSKENAGNDVRYEEWSKGFELITTNMAVATVGVGIGSSAAQIENDGYEATSHYESTLFQSFSEGGIFGFLLRYAPGFFALFFLLFSFQQKSYLRFMIGVWLMTYFASIFSAPTAAGYHVQATYYIAAGLAACWPYYDRGLMRRRLRARERERRGSRRR